MLLKLVLVAGAQHSRIAPSAGEGDNHGLLKELEALNLVDGLYGGLWVFKDDKGLALCFEVRLGNNVDNLSVVGEDGGQSLLEGLGFDPFFEVADIDTVVLGNTGREVFMLAGASHIQT